MASAAPPTQASLPFGRRDRPWLLPSNRKLRNLVSISLRNISLDAPSTGRRRGKTIDDDAVPHTLKSPAKIVALREQRVLEHSRSSDDLRKVVEDAESSSAVEDGGKDDRSPVKGKAKVASDVTPTRPKFGRTRRRSTLEWVNATPQRRQERLEKLAEERMVDVFFSLHVKGLEGMVRPVSKTSLKNVALKLQVDPVYISETVERTMNPTFRHVDFANCGPGITRLEQVTVRVWVHGARMEKWRQLLEVEVDLRNMQYLGKTLDNIALPLPQNAMILQLTDGIYTPTFTALDSLIPPPQMLSAGHPAGPVRSGSSRILPTSSFDALLRLAKLDDSIQDALSVRNRLASDLENLLLRNREALEQRDEVQEAEDRVKTIDYAKMTVQKQVDKARNRIEERRSSLLARRNLMAQDLANRTSRQKSMELTQAEIPHLRDELDIRKKATHAQRRRITEDLQKIYPIAPLPKQSLAFTIRDLHLPDSEDLDSVSVDDVAAALGHTAHTLLLLSYYLSQPLVYPVNIRGSTSTIEDSLSLLKTNASTTTKYADESSLRTYPLYSRSVPRFRFEYALFLLNKNIQLLLESCFAVRVLDIRQTLPNLKYLLYVATAGEGELPARKAGGVRGLVRAGQMLRTGSDASTASGFSGLGRKEGAANGKPKGSGPHVGAAESLRMNIGGKK